MPKSHIVQSYDKELNQLETLILEMGGLVETQLTNSILALINKDLELAARIVRGDSKVDGLEDEISNLAINTLARRQPMADDLRRVVASLKISANLERIGDYAKNIAKRTEALANTPPMGSSSSTIKRMGRLVQEMTGDVLDAFVAHDIEVADEILLRDEEVDQIHNGLFRELLTYMMEDASSISACMHLLFIAKNLERAGDQTTTIAEQIHYMVSGAIPEFDRPKGDETSTMVIHTRELDSDS